MDPAAFDQLTRFVTAVRARRSRRSLGGLGLGLVGALLGVESVAAKPCPKGRKKCKKKCIAKKKCCTNANCKPAATHKVCKGGRCLCAPGFKPCPRGTCIPTAGCCGGCSPNQNCVNGACVCAPGFKPCQGGCIAEDGCCGGCPPGQRCSEAACVPSCGTPGIPCRVFVTSTTTTGAMGGLTGADAKCQGHAEAAGLTGTYKAWLSDSASSPSTRFTNTANTGPYQLVGGTQIAANWAALTDGGIDSHIDRTESGGLPPDDLVWTKTTTAGTLWEQNTTCNEWLSTGALLSAGGDTTRLDEAWTEGFGGSLCSNSYPLYCFEQG
jgi:hypothetical protein